MPEATMYLIVSSDEPSKLLRMPSASLEKRAYSGHTSSTWSRKQRPGHRVLAALGDLLDAGRLLDDRLRLAHDLFAERRHADLVGAAFEQLDVELFFELLDGDAQRRLRDEAGLGGTAKMFFTGDGDDVSKFGERHGGRSMSAPAATCT